MSFQQYRPSGFNVLPPVVKNLLIINGIFFLATVVLKLKMDIDLADLLGLHYFFSEEFKPYQLVTYMFMHGGLTHILFNMFALWMFGNTLENIWGGKRFLIYYMVCGLGAALLHYTVHYFEIQPVMHALDDYILNPSTDKLNALIDSKVIVLSTPEMAQKLEPLYAEFRSQLFTGNTESALQTSIDFVI